MVCPSRISIPQNHFRTTFSFPNTQHNVCKCFIRFSEAKQTNITKLAPILFPSPLPHRQPNCQLNYTTFTYKIFCDIQTATDATCEFKGMPSAANNKPRHPPTPKYFRFKLAKHILSHRGINQTPKYHIPSNNIT